MLHILKSPRCYKVRYIFLVILRTTKFKLVPLSHLQGESQVYVFYLLVEVGFLPFYEHRFLKLQYLKSPGPRSNPVRRMFDKTLNSADVKNVRRPVGKKVLAHSCGEMSAGFTNITSITTRAQVYNSWR